MKNGLDIDLDGTQRWYFNDQLHREDGPAVIYTDGTKCWYQHGKRHRLDGPAGILHNNTKFWFIDGLELTGQEFKNYLIKRNLQIIVK